MSTLTLFKAYIRAIGQARGSLEMRAAGGFSNTYVGVKNDRFAILWQRRVRLAETLEHRILDALRGGATR